MLTEYIKTTLVLPDRPENRVLLLHLLYERLSLTGGFSVRIIRLTRKRVNPHE